MNLKKSTFVNFAVLFVTVLLCFILLEVFVRFFFPTPEPLKVENSFTFFQYDPYLGWVNKPNSSAMFSMPDSVSFVNINSKGLRDKEYTYEKTDKFRIVMLGDSFTWGYGLNASQRFSDVLGSYLGNSVEVINAGVSGYGTGQELLFLKREIYKYQPDLVLLAFSTPTDFFDVLNYNTSGYPKPKMVLLENGSLETANVPVPLKTDWNTLPSESRDKFYQKIHDFLSHSKAYTFFLERALNSFSLRKFLSSVGLLDDYLLYDTQYSNDTVDLIDSIIKEMHDYTESIDSDFAIFLIPSKEQTYKNYDRWRNDVILGIGEKDNITVIDSLPRFKEVGKYEPNLFFVLDGHCNEKGNLLAGQILYDNLQHLVPTLK